MSRTKRKEPPHHLRHPHTANEKRAVDSAIEEGVHVRPARNAKHLPSVYDDKIHSARDEIWRARE